MSKLSVAKVLAVLTVMLSFVNVTVAQDTLHLNYKGIETKMRDTTEAKIDAWVKKMGGKKVEVVIVGYFNEADFKQYATERADETFLLVTRKARDFVTIKSSGPKKGKKYQRCMVDIIYTAAGLTDVVKETSKNGKSDEGKGNKEDNASVKSEHKPSANELAYGHPGTKAVGQGQVLKAADVKTIKSSKIVVAQTGVALTDSAMVAAVKNHWDFTSDIQVMPYNKALTYAAGQENVLIFILANAKPLGTLLGAGPEAKYRILQQGVAVMLEDKKGAVIASAYIPSYGLENFIMPEAINFGVSIMNYELKVMDQKEMVNNINTAAAYKELAGDKLKAKTLYIPEGWLNDKFNKNEIAGLYEGKCEVVNYQTWSSVVNEKKEGVYVMVAPRPVAGSFTYQHYLVDAQTGAIYGICHPKINSSLSKSNTGFINDAYIKRYNDAIKGEW